MQKVWVIVVGSVVQNVFDHANDAIIALARFNDPEAYAVEMEVNKPFRNNNEPMIRRKHLIVGNIEDR